MTSHFSLPLCDPFQLLAKKSCLSKDEIGNKKSRRRERFETRKICGIYVFIENSSLISEVPFWCEKVQNKHCDFQTCLEGYKMHSSTKVNDDNKPTNRSNVRYRTVLDVFRDFLTLLFFSSAIKPSINRGKRKICPCKIPCFFLHPVYEVLQVLRSRPSMSRATV